MASSSGSAITKSEDENDERKHSIPGASLQGRLPSDLTVTELTRWLKCRQGASLKGRRPELVARYVLCYFRFLCVVQNDDKVNIIYYFYSEVACSLENKVKVCFVII